jgi:MFS superfamily sulfate permease-like transporter
MIKRFLPFLKWYEGYNFQKFRYDFIAGITVALVLIPQSMAYAQLAGLPAYYGLYAAFLPPMIASLFGSSNQLATGPVAVVSLMTSASLEPLATAGSEAFIAYAILLAIMVGLFQFMLGLLRLGIFVNLLSHPVVIGFTTAAAIIIATSQLSKIFGVHVEKAEHHYETIYRVIVSALDYTHLPTLGIAVLAFLIMIILKRINPKIPNVLAAAVITIIISWYFGFENSQKTKLSMIQAPKIQETIKNYNYLISEIAFISGANRANSNSTDKNIHIFKTQNQPEEFCSRCHIGRSFTKLGNNNKDYVPLEPEEIMDLAHYAGLPQEYLNMLKEKCAEYRTEVRQAYFEGVKTADGIIMFYLHGHVPPDKQGDGLVWRIKVKNSTLDESSILISAGGDIVNHIPSGLPTLSVPVLDFSIISQLILATFIISLLGFMEAISIARAMATKTGQRLDANQELIGQGIANIIGALGQSYPVSGSFSRSAVNLQAGGVTGLSNVLSSIIVAITLLFFTPLLYHLPQAVLAAIIMMAVIGLLNVRNFIHAFLTQKYDGTIAIVTFIATLFFAPHLDRGIIIGVLLSLGHLIYRRIEPRIALLSKHWDGTYRNAERFGLAQCCFTSLIRFQGSLTFSNCNHLEEKILEQTSTRPRLKYILIVGNAINEVDASGESMLSNLIPRLKEKNFEIFFTGLNDSILDVLRRTGLYEVVGEDNFFRNVSQAVDFIHAKAHKHLDQKECPLLSPIKLDEFDEFDEINNSK